MISQETIEAVKERASLLDIIGETVAFKRQGLGYVGLCPFHGEKSPSFHLRDNERYYHCFGCGVSGNAITYVMETRGLSFPEAIEYLASRYSIELKYQGVAAKNQKPDQKPAYYNTNKIAQSFFVEALRRADKEVLEYVQSRGLSSESLISFGVGYAPRGGNPLSQFLRTQGVSEELQLQSGLVRRNARGEIYDAYRGRLIFPIWSDTKRIAGFGGRLIPALFDEESSKRSPKYINSPESPIYEKSKILFALPQALPHIRTSGEVYFVEGYMDVIGLWQVGVQNVVAACGTALSEHHLKKVGRLAHRATVLFDGDAAGRTAAARSFVTFLNADIDVSAVFLPDGEDPDTYAQTHGTKTAQLLTEAPRVPLLECYLDFLIGQYDCSDASQLGASAVAKVSEELMRSLVKVKKTIVLHRFIETSASKLRLKPDVLFQLAEQMAKGVKIEMRPTETEESTESLSLDTAGMLKQKEIEQLPRLDREILLAVMAKKDQLAVRVLRDAQLCQALDACTLHFVEGLAAALASGALASAGETESDTKEQIKALLKLFGNSWVQHWKKAYEMAETSGVNLQQSFDECCRAVKKNKANQLVIEVDRRIAEANEETEQLRLHQERLTLLRKIKEL